MIKRQRDPVDAAAILRFVRESSDFDLEMKVVELLRAQGFKCVHGGTYQDPITQKIRQFDVRAERAAARHHVSLAVECKNLRDDGPLLVSCVPRVREEAFHHILRTPRDAIRVLTEEVSGQETPYVVGESVAKKTDQIRRSGDGFVSDDQATFDKMSQAISSTYDLVRMHLTPSNLLFAVLPVVVIPDGRLWQVNYSASGVLETEPTKVPSAALFLDHAWSFGTSATGVIRFRLSHLEFVTVGHLPVWLADRSESLFPKLPSDIT